jgi:hypothetical protein
MDILPRVKGVVSNKLITFSVAVQASRLHHKEIRQVIVSRS